MVPNIINNPIFSIVSLNPVNKNLGMSYKGIPKKKQRDIDPKKRTKNGFNFK